MSMSFVQPFHRERFSFRENIKPTIASKNIIPQYQNLHRTALLLLNSRTDCMIIFRIPQKLRQII